MRNGQISMAESIGLTLSGNLRREARVVGLLFASTTSTLIRAGCLERIMSHGLPVLSASGAGWRVRSSFCSLRCALLSWLHCFRAVVLWCT